MNLVKQAIEKAQQTDKETFTVPKIAVACAVSESAIYNYMSHRNTPPEVIVSLSAYLHDLSLRDRYCSQECPIGKCKNPNGYCERDLQTVGFMTGHYADEFNKMFDMIYDIYKDGERTRDEEILFIENSTNLYQAREVIDNLINIREEFLCKYSQQ